MATLLGPVGGGLAGYPMGMGMDANPAGGHDAVTMEDIGHHTAMAGEAAEHPATQAETAAHHQMGGNDCGEHDSGESHRCAGLWSTACCDYFAPGSKIEIYPAPESSSPPVAALSVTLAADNLEPAATWSHLILPTVGEGRAGPVSLVILHSALLI